MTNNYSRNWTKQLKERGYSQFQFAELPDDLRVFRLHRRAISNGLVRRVGFRQGARSNQVVGVWKVTI